MSEANIPGTILRDTEKNRRFWAFLQENARQLALLPVSSGGKGLGVPCPCCRGNRFVTRDERRNGLIELLMQLEVRE